MWRERQTVWDPFPSWDVPLPSPTSFSPWIPVHPAFAPPVSTFLHTLAPLLAAAAAAAHDITHPTTSRPFIPSVPQPADGLFWNWLWGDSCLRYKGCRSVCVVGCCLSSSQQRTWTFPAVHLFSAWCEDVFSRQTSIFFTLKVMFLKFLHKGCLQL